MGYEGWPGTRAKIKGYATFLDPSTAETYTCENRDVVLETIAEEAVVFQEWIDLPAFKNGELGDDKRDRRYLEQIVGALHSMVGFARGLSTADIKARELVEFRKFQEAEEQGLTPRELEAIREALPAVKRKYREDFGTDIEKWTGPVHGPVMILPDPDETWEKVVETWADVERTANGFRRFMLHLFYARYRAEALGDSEQAEAYERMEETAIGHFGKAHPESIDEVSGELERLDAENRETIIEWVGKVVAARQQVEAENNADGDVKFKTSFPWRQWGDEYVARLTPARPAGIFRSMFEGARSRVR